MTRTKNSLRNIKYSILGQSITLISNFITRMVFVRVLSAEYLGLNGLFTNILSILSLAELGIGASIVFSMYRPLAEKNENKLKSLMIFYRKSYINIGIFVLVSGILLLPFLEFFIKDVPNIYNLNLIYLMYVVNTGFSYFYSYKRSFLVADQKKYIDSIYHYSFFLLRNLLQILILLVAKNFILYLGIQIIITIVENITISKKVDSLYPFLQNKSIVELDQTEKQTIYKNVKAMVFHKLGSVIVMSTDNLLISKFVGIIEVGIYSNYLLITQAINQIFGIVFQSITASIGNLGALESRKKNEMVFRYIDFIGLWIYGFAAISLFTLFNPFIHLWLGDKYLFSGDIVFLIVISFYLTGRRKSVLTFRDALGLFWYDRYKPIFESIINIVVSIVLARNYGISGIIIGTIISTITTSFWVEPFVLYKYGFKSSMRSYLRRYIFRSSTVFFIGTLNYGIASLLGYSFISFLGKLIITAIIPNLIFIIVFWKTEEFQYFYKIIKTIVKAHTENKND